MKLTMLLFGNKVKLSDWNGLVNRLTEQGVAQNECDVCTELLKPVGFPFKKPASVFVGMTLVTGGFNQRCIAALERATNFKLQVFPITTTVKNKYCFFFCCHVERTLQLLRRTIGLTFYSRRCFHAGKISVS